MSTLRVANINNASAPAGGISIDTSGTVTGALPYPNRNLLYNGAMQIHQRSSSAAGITGGNYYTSDRWFMGNVTMGTWTQSIENDAPTGSGFRKSLRVLCTTADASPAAGDYLQIQQYLEGQDLQRIAKGTASAQQLTLSFWVKSNVTGTYIVGLTDSDNSRYIASSYTINVSGAWERKTITFSGDTSGVFDNDNNLSLQVTWWLGAGSTYTSGTLSTAWASIVNGNYAAGQTNLAAAINNYWQITGVQLETGPVATPFEFKSYGQELRECQRYFCLLTKATGSGGPYDVNNCSMTFRYPSTMRASANVTFPASLTNAVQWIGKGTVTPVTITTSMHSSNGFQANLATTNGYPSISTYSQAVWDGNDIQASSEL